MKIWAIALLFAPLTSLSQVHIHAAPPAINGAEHPELVSDQRAWLMQLIASTSSSTNDELTKQHAAVHQQAMGLAVLDLSSFRLRFDQLITNYNGEIANVTVRSTAEQQQAQQQLNNDIADLLAEMVGYIQRNLTNEEWQVTNARLQESKKKIAGIRESSSVALVPMAWHLRLTDLLDFNNESAGGYSQYTALDSDGTYSYQTVHLYGSTNQAWSCTWTQVGQYNWAWEPPGCPASHDVKLTNQIDGNGPIDLDEGAYSPATYISLSQTIRIPFDEKQHSIKSGAKVICSIIGEFYTFVLSFLTAYGQSNFAWNGQGTLTTCGVNPTCTNPRPWLVDGSSVYVGSQRCVAAWKCIGTCFFNPIALDWVCTPHNTPLEVCRILSQPTWEVCTRYP